MAEDALGRHCGTIWPLAQGAWGLAALHAGRPDLFENELRLMASKAVRDMHFYEIYHSESGLPYGGWQEWEGKTVLWTSCRKQSWSASAYLALVLKGVAGLVRLRRQNLRPPPSAARRQRNLSQAYPRTRQNV